MRMGFFLPKRVFQMTAAAPAHSSPHLRRRKRTVVEAQMGRKENPSTTKGLSGLQLSEMGNLSVAGVTGLSRILGPWVDTCLNGTTANHWMEQKLHRNFYRTTDSLPFWPA